MKRPDRKEYTIQHDTNFEKIIEEINAEKITDVLISSEFDDELRLSNKQTVSLITAIITETNICNLMAFNKLHLGDNIAPITNALKTNTSLHELIISHNDIGPKGVGLIADALKINETLEFLDVAANSIGFDGTKLIAEALVINKGLKKLNLSVNQISIEGLRLVLDSLQTNTILQDLHIACNEIGLEGVRLITDFLKAGSKLLTLNLTGNQIGLEGARLIADILKTDTILEYLYLTDTGIGTEGVKLLMESLKTNSTICFISVVGNLTGEEGGRSIIDCLKKNRAVVLIESCNNGISMETYNLIELYNKNNKKGYEELGKFILYNQEEINKGDCVVLGNLKLVPHQEKGESVIPPAIRSFLTLLPKVSSGYLGDTIIENMKLVNNLKLLIAGNFFEISGICKKPDDDHQSNKDSLLLSLSKDLIALIAYDIPIAVYAKPSEDSVEVAGDLEHVDDN
jgi:hypothetical protein